VSLVKSVPHPFGIVGIRLDKTKVVLVDGSDDEGTDVGVVLGPFGGAVSGLDLLEEIAEAYRVQVDFEDETPFEIIGVGLRSLKLRDSSDPQ
jgi:hypothetical protein